MLVLAATNRPQAVDAALLRPGRFDLLLFVPPPDYEGRLQTLLIHSRNMPLDKDVNLASLAAETHLYTGTVFILYVNIKPEFMTPQQLLFHTYHVKCYDYISIHASVYCLHCCSKLEFVQKSETVRLLHTCVLLDS